MNSIFFIIFTGGYVDSAFYLKLPLPYIPVYAWNWHIIDNSRRIDHVKEHVVFGVCVKMVCGKAAVESGVCRFAPSSSVCR